MKKNRRKKNRHRPAQTVILLLLLACVGVMMYLNAGIAERGHVQIPTVGPTGQEVSGEGQTDADTGASPDAADGRNPNGQSTVPQSAPAPELEYVSAIQELALRGRVPDPEGWHESEDGAELTAFLKRDEVQRLLKGRSTVWNEGIERFPDTPLRWYFDETILCIVWQEAEAQAVGTFSEVFIQDGSQLRRKIAGDELFSFAFKTTTQFSQETNAVLAFGGDFYHHGRACGIGFYQRKLYRFEPDTCDTCWVTADGDLLFTYRGQIGDQTEAERFAEENDVLFTLVFGPVLIDNGVDVTPEQYPWGEVDDTYARAALGLLERHHYLTMNINCWQPGTEYYNLATLRQEADAMLKRGCCKAYALDGGQTATTVFGGRLINPVQFGEEKDISDIIYFASALGGERKEVS